MPITAEEKQLIIDRKVKRVVLTSGETKRVFVTKDGILCEYAPKSSRRGYRLHESLVASIVQEKPEKTVDELNFQMVSKFRKQAEKSTFTNDFIKDCLKLPKTFEQWVLEGKKSPYEYGVTTGCKITGDLVSVDSICKKARWDADRIREAIKNRAIYRTSFDFNGYDGSVSFEINDDGVWRGFLSKEYRGCGNGYYYILINDDYFIGYDVD